MAIPYTIKNNNYHGNKEKSTIYTPAPHNLSNCSFVVKALLI